MPNKTIYVSDDDLPLFAKAQELVGGNLSGAIAAALRRFIEIEEARQSGFEDMVVPLGPGGALRKRFSGRLLGEDIQHEKHAIVRQRVYGTRTGKYVLHVQRSAWAKGSGNWVADLADWRGMLGIGMPRWGDYTLTVVETREELQRQIPDDLYQAVMAVQAHPDIEDLDI